MKCQFFQEVSYSDYCTVIKWIYFNGNVIVQGKRGEIKKVYEPSRDVFVFGLFYNVLRHWRVETCWIKVYGETHLSISLLPVFPIGWKNSYEKLVVFKETIIDRQFAAMSDDKNHSFLLIFTFHENFLLSLRVILLSCLLCGK